MYEAPLFENSQDQLDTSLPHAEAFAPTRYNLRQRSNARHPSLHTLTRQAILLQISTAQVGQRIKITWCTMGEWTVETDEGTIVSRHGAVATVLYDHLGSLPLPPSDPTVCVLDISLSTSPFFLKPINLSNRPLDLHTQNVTMHIYCDGGCRSGPGSAAILVQQKHPLGTTSHARFYTNVTNNIAESLALLAALRFAARCNDHLIVIIVDSLNVYNWALGISKCSDSKIKPIMEEARAVFLSVCGRIVLAHMLRSFGNPADAFATAAINTATGVGDETLFADAPEASLPKRRPAQTSPTLHLNTRSLQINSIDDFAAVRLHKCRSRVPPPAVPLWSLLVKFQLQKIVNAATPQEWEEEVISLFILPNSFLPVRFGIRKTIRNLELAQPLDLSKTLEHKAPRESAGRHHRLVENIQRCAQDLRLRSANKLLQQVSQNDDLALEEKLEALQSKICPDGPPTTIIHKNISFFSTSEVRKACGIISRQSASAIDGWSADLLTQAMQHEASIAEDLAVMLT